MRTASLVAVHTVSASVDPILADVGLNISEEHNSKRPIGTNTHRPPLKQAIFQRVPGSTLVCTTTLSPSFELYQLSSKTNLKFPSCSWLTDHCKVLRPKSTHHSTHILERKTNRTPGRERMRAPLVLNENQRSYHFHLAVGDDRLHSTVIIIICASLDRLVRIRNADEKFPVCKTAHGL